MSAVADKMFTAHVRDDLPLSALLVDPARNARENAEIANAQALEAMPDDGLAEYYLQQWDQRFSPVEILDLNPATEPRSAERHAADPADLPDRLSVWRWRVEFRVTGQTEILARWPDMFDAEPCGSDTQLLPIPWVFWQQEGNGVVAYFDVARDDDPDGTTLPSERIQEATTYLRRAAEAANSEVAERREDLAAELEELIRARRERLGRIEVQRTQLIELVRQQFGAIEVERVDGPAPHATGDGDVEEIVLNYVVSDGSFDQLVEVTRRWSDGAERYPQAFGALHEEEITSLLVTTLNVAFDVAHREVYHSKGKTDIFVQSNVGKTNEAAHIGEAKVWNGQKEVHTGNKGNPGHVEQVLGYANGRTSRLLLIYYVRQMSLAPIEEKAYEGVANCRGFRDWNEADGRRIAVFEHPTFGQEIRLSLLFVHLPKEGAPDPDADGSVAA